MPEFIFIAPDFGGRPPKIDLNGDLYNSSAVICL